MDEVFDIVPRKSEHTKRFCEAMQAGLTALGLKSRIVPDPAMVRSKTVFCWGYNRGAQMLRKAGRDVFVLEHGYLGDRHKWTSLAMNGLNGRGSFAATPDDGGARFQEHHAALYKPWNPDGDYALVVGQVAGDAALQGRDLAKWYEQACAILRARGMRVIFRQHPVEKARGFTRTVKGAETSTRTLEEDLAQAFLVVTFNSNTGVEAVLAGKPVIAADQGSMAYAMADGNNLQQWQTNEPPNRKNWAHALAWCQWTEEEIASGDALLPFIVDKKDFQGSMKQ